MKIQDLDGQVSIVVQFLQETSDLVPIEMGIFPKDDLEVGFELALVCSEAALLVGQHDVLADLVVAGEEGFKLDLGRHVGNYEWIISAETGSV